MAKPTTPPPPPPGMRTSTRPQTSAVPPGVDPPGLRRGRPEGPAAVVPVTAPGYPKSDVMMIGVCAVFLGVHTMLSPLTTAGWWVGFGFTTFGLLIGGVWVRLWWLWHTAWGRWKP